MGVAIPTVLAGLGSKFAANVIIFQGHPRGSLLLSSENVTATVVKDEGESRKGNEKKRGWEAFADQEKKKKEGREGRKGRKERKKRRKEGEKKEEKKKKCMCVFRNTGIFLADLKLRK